MISARVVVVLSGGGAKAAAHLGAARALAEVGVVPVHWVGASMGGVVAAALASGESPDAILQRFLSVERKDVLVLRRFAALRGVWSTALFKPEPFREALSRITPARTFAELKYPCTVVAVEKLTGTEVSFGTNGENAPLLDVFAATCALPPYFPPAVVNGREFYDGGLRSPLPLRQAEKIACDFVVAIHVAPGFDETGPAVETPPPLIAASDTAIGWLMSGTVELLRERWDNTPGAAPLVWVRPVAERGATFALDRARAYADSGYLAMKQALEALG